MSKKYFGAAMLPHPRRISRAIRTITALILLAYGISGIFYPAPIILAVGSQIPAELRLPESLTLTRENIIMITALASLVLAFVLLRKSGNSLR